MGGGDSTIWGGGELSNIPKCKRSHFPADLPLQIKNSIFVLGGNNNLEENQLGSIGSTGAHLFRRCKIHKY